MIQNFAGQICFQSQMESETLDKKVDVDTLGTRARHQGISRGCRDLEGLLLQILDVGVEAQDVKHPVVNFF
jgi:hypothetical protein